MAEKPITQRAIREMRRRIKQLEAENRELRSENGALRRTYYLEYNVRGAKQIATTSPAANIMAAIRTARLLGFGVVVREYSDTLGYYAIPTEAPRNV